MLAGMLACWRQIAEGVEGASIEEVPGANVAVFPIGPERAFYNNAVLARGLDEAAAKSAVDEIVAAYDAAGVDRYAVWAPESEAPSIAVLSGRGFTVDTETQPMAMSLDRIAVPRPEIELGDPDWTECLRIIEVPEGTLAGVDAGAFEVLVASSDGENAAAGLAFDHAGDCGIYNVGTLPHARRRGLGTALTALHLYRARERGCTTASLQSTPEAAGIYASLGFRDLGRFVEYVPT